MKKRFENRNRQRPLVDQLFTKITGLDLKLEQYEEAEHRGIQALALGQEFHQEKVIKNSHYLLGEIYSEVGRRGDADQHFDALSKFYPDFPALKGFLHQVNVVGMINLRA